jgi:hypothetical protein
MRIRTALAACGLVAAVVAGTAGIAAAVASASDPLIVNGNSTSESVGDTTTNGTDSPDVSLVQGSLNKPCVGVDGRLAVGSLLGLLPLDVQDVHLLDSPRNQQCVRGSDQDEGDAPLSHVLSDNRLVSHDR